MSLGQLVAGNSLAKTFTVREDVFDILLSPPEGTPEDIAAVVAAMNSGWIAPAGPELSRFEAALAQHCKAEAAVALSSGTAALHLIATIGGVGVGDWVLCPTLTFAATANSIAYTGAELRFIDCGDDMNIDTELLAEVLEESAKLGDLPKAVVTVDLYGNPVNYSEVHSLLSKYGILHISDGAESLGSKWAGEPAASQASLTALSFNGNKIITTSGGGALVGERALVEQARHLSTQARTPMRHYVHDAVGYNYRMSNLLAALGVSQLARLPKIVERRRKVRQTYDALFEGSEVSVLNFDQVDSGALGNAWLTVIDLSMSEITPDVAINALEQVRVEARRGWNPMHRQPIFQECVVYRGHFADRWFRETVCLPSGQSLTRAQQEMVVSSLLETVR